MLNPNFPVLAGWSGKEQSLEFLFPPLPPPTPSPAHPQIMHTSGMPRGISLCWAIVQTRMPPCDLGLRLGRHPHLAGRWQATFAWLDFDLPLPTLVICEISPDCHTEWARPVSLCNQAPGRLCQTECWSGRRVPEPDFCSGQVLNMTPMESKGQENPDQDLHTILVWVEKGTYAPWGKHGSYKITV